MIELGVFRLDLFRAVKLQKKEASGKKEAFLAAFYPR